MSKPDYNALAERLRGAYGGTPVPPMRDGLEPGDADGAYAVQRLNTQHWVKQGRRIVGRKIGLTAKAVQTQLGVDQPDFGVLFADMEVPDGGTLATSSLIKGRVEAEVALVLGRDLDSPDVGYGELLRAVEYAVPALEIVDSRIADWKITFADTVADNGSSAYYVLGREPKSLSGLDLLTCGMIMEFDGSVVSMGVGAACLGHPLISAAWLAKTLAQAGEPLRAGDVVLTGALGPMVDLKPGIHVRAQVGGLGSVGFNFREA
ncbi:2-keto-4-pentenoate hydratase [Phenylobacterium immobile]|uniref:2-keto-4-pentenoate hydratase n=1 Tax=Phenylobacterium immobile TaxID=21 RepID=UPI000AB55BB5|nr:fumarylacetoacetate hydrolase family protein [Phenylobacterium immobile]